MTIKSKNCTIIFADLIFSNAFKIYQDEKFLYIQRVP